MNYLHKKILVIVFAAFCIILPSLTFVFVPREATPFSENENRYLSAFVKPDFAGYAKNFFNKRPNNIKNKQFMNEFDSWFADRFLLRENWIVLQNELEMLSGKSEINGVFVTDDKLIQAWREERPWQSIAENENLTYSLTAVNEFAAQMKELYQTKSYIMLIPTAQEIYADLLPPNSQPGNQAALIKHCYDNLEQLTPIGVATYLAENANRYIYYRTDHHWTTYGAYWGYYAAAKTMGLTPYELGRFNVEHASSDFRGTLFSKTLNSRITPDVIQFYTLFDSGDFAPGFNSVLHINHGSEITKHDSLYLREYLDTKDKYAAFMGQNSPFMEVYTDVENYKSLLIFKDSFAHCMIPFLANHYSRITVLDLRYINTALRELEGFELENYGEVLFVYSATNFAEDTALRRLK